MAAPEFVPAVPTQKVRRYMSSPWLEAPWFADRPAEVSGVQPRGPLLGSPGPDLGYALKLVRSFEGNLHLTADERESDAISGCGAIAMRRASLFGRAPIMHDLTMAFTMWGFLEVDPPRELVELRRGLFEEIAEPHHYDARRVVVDMIPDETLLMPHTAVEVRAWRDLLGLES